MAGQQVPSAGRVVHFVYGDRHVPAIIIDPEPDQGNQITLFVMTKNDGTFTGPAPFDLECAPATWHWPEFVPNKEG